MSIENLTQYQLYRPVVPTDGIKDFLANVRIDGLEVFGTEFAGVRNDIKVEDGLSGEPEPTSTGEPIFEPRLTVYGNGQGTLRLPMVDLLSVPELNYRGKFINADRRLRNNPGVSGARNFEPQALPLPQGTAENQEQQPLMVLYEKIGHKYGITDQNELHVACRTIDAPVNFLLEHLGVEVYLIPKPGELVTQMLKEQVGASLRGLGKKSRELVNPNTPATLGIPFARMPRNTSPDEYKDFAERVSYRLERAPVVVELEGVRPH